MCCPACCRLVGKSHFFKICINRLGREMYYSVCFGDDGILIIANILTKQDPHHSPEYLIVICVLCYLERQNESVRPWWLVTVYMADYTHWQAHFITAHWAYGSYLPPPTVTIHLVFTVSFVSIASPELSVLQPPQKNRYFHPNFISTV